MVSDWAQIVGTTLLSAVVAYAVTSARVIREENAKLRAAARHQLPAIFGGWIAEAESISRNMGGRVRAYDNPANELYFGYEECSALVQQTRSLNGWERYLIKQFCVRAFSPGVYDLARRIPADSRPKIFDEIGTHTIMDNGEQLKTTLSRAEIVHALFQAADFDGVKYYFEFNGHIATMRMHVGNADAGKGVAQNLAQAQELAKKVVVICERFQYLKLWRVPGAFIQATFTSLRKTIRGRLKHIKRRSKVAA